MSRSSGAFWSCIEGVMSFKVNNFFAGLKNNDSACFQRRTLATKMAVPSPAAKLKKRMSQAQEAHDSTQHRSLHAAGVAHMQRKTEGQPSDAHRIAPEW